MNWSVMVSCAPLICSLALAAGIDARVRRIPNWLTFGMLLGGVGGRGTGGADLDGRGIAGTGNRTGAGGGPAKDGRVVAKQRADRGKFCGDSGAWIEKRG